MDDVSGVADVSKKLANFLRVSRKFGHNCVCVFHVIDPASQIWQKNISQTNILVKIINKNKSKNGPGRYRSSADNPKKQVCYFNKPNDEVFIILS